MITILCFGEIKNKGLLENCQEYEKRLQTMNQFRSKRISLKPKSMSENEKAILDFKEKSSENKYILLDEKGKDIASVELSKKLTSTLLEQDIVFIIGDADGFSDEFKTNFETIRISACTFTHEMTEMLLWEQIYRSAMISEGRSYHKV